MELKSIIGKIAPMLASAVGGPLGGLAVSAITEAMGLSDKTEGAIKQALLGATHEQMLAIKVAEHSFALKMREIGFDSAKDLESIAAGDMADARRREIAVKDSTPRNLAYLITVGFFGILLFMVFYEIPASARDIVNIMVGTLGASFSGVIGYFFGSSAGSAKKTLLLSKAEPIND